MNAGLDDKIRDVSDEYKRLIEKSTGQLESTKKRISFISNIRLTVAIIVIAGIIIFCRSNPTLSFAFLITGSVLFFPLVINHESLHRSKKRLEHYLKVVHRAHDRVNDAWLEYFDYGNEFIESEHPYCLDLDIFGKGSIFQWLSSSHTFYGRKQLSSDLLKSPETIEQIRERQGAIRDCSAKLDFRLEFEAIAFDSKVQCDQEQLLKWAENKQFHWSSIIPHLFTIGPIIVAIAAISSVVFFKLPIVAYLLYTIHIVIFGMFYLSNKKFMDKFEKNGAVLLMYSELLSCIEKTSFTDSLLLKLKNELVSDSISKVSIELKKLASMISSMEIRYNPLGHFIANVILLWDLRIRSKAEAWKKKNGKNIRKWFDVIGRFESLNSFSAIAYEHPEWQYAKLQDEKRITCDDIGHPLIPKNKRVCNNFSIQDNHVAIITGSNMSGKSTFLRTVGVNMILAYAGAPVCGKNMCIPRVKIFSSMRIGDDLTGNISTFYAELLKIKKIIEADKAGDVLLFLLDELFRGTNSTDRHEGAVAVLAKLKKSGNIGLISTHDLALCELGQTPDNGYENYHFVETYNDHGIAFDYQLKQGPSNTRNALYLIKMLGIV
jgi:ABC-type multidrug transport system fused ATPase/permease subunit